jgi:hypothetical protein
MPGSGPFINSSVAMGDSFPAYRTRVSLTDCDTIGDSAAD